MVVFHTELFSTFGDCLDRTVLERSQDTNRNILAVLLSRLNSRRIPNALIFGRSRPKANQQRGAAGLPRFSGWRKNCIERPFDVARA